MSVKIPLAQVIAGGFTVCCISFSLGAKLQTKYLRYLIKITSTTENDDTRRLAARLVHESLNLRFILDHEEK